MNLPAQDDKNKSEMFRLVFDFLKHLTTLSSGSILLILTLAEKFFKDPSMSRALFVSLGAFLVSIVAALVAMAVLSFNISAGHLAERRAPFWFAWGFVTSAAGFFGGMGLIIITVFSQYG